LLIIAIADDLPNHFSRIEEAIQWVQGDYSIFVQKGRPAIAISSQWFIENINSQKITHTSKYNIDIVGCNKLVGISNAFKYLIEKIKT